LSFPTAVCAAPDSVIVRDFDIRRVTIDPLEANAPLLVNANAMFAFALALEGLKPIGDRDRQVFQFASSVQLLQFMSVRS
jgi:hypothetical protein